jgi:hypothetical protein
MVHTLLLLACAILADAAIVCGGQMDGQLSISGTVVNAVTGAPVPFARVALSNGNCVEADGVGRFRFSGLAPATYDVTASKAGFDPVGSDVVGSQGRLEISPSTSVENYMVKLNPLAAIRGRVVDGDGEPVESAVVTVLQSSVVYGRRQLHAVNFVQTNDRGDYRVSNLTAGKYVVQAAGGTSHRGYYGEKAPMIGATDSFAPTYFGGAHRANAAQSVVLGPGVEARADIAVQLETEHIIRGRIANYRPHAMANLLVSSGDADRGLGAVTLEYATGAFEIHGIRDGAYRLLAYQKDDEQNLIYGECRIEVAGRDLEHVVLNLAPPASVRGVVQSDASPTGNAPLLRMHLVPQDMILDELGGERWSDPVSTGAFVIPSVPPGRYWVDFESDGQYIASARAEDTDLLATREVVISAAGEPSIEIVLRGGGGSIQGMIESTLAAARTEAMALLVPEACNRPAALTNAGGGEFAFTDVAPGAYRVYAWKQDNELEYGTSAGLCALARGGIPVTVQPGRATTVRLPGFSEEPK